MVLVTLEEALQPFTEIPMIAPSISGVQMFVNHPQVVAYLREQTAHFLANRVGPLLGLEDWMEQELIERIPQIGELQANATLSTLAAGLPVFKAHFRRDGAVTVSEAGSIPG